MPTYAYTCTACGHAFDIHQAFTDDALTVCPECGGRLRKVFSSVGVTFKGSGFYRTDSRSSKSSSTGSTTSSTPSKSSDAGGSSTSGSTSSGSSSSGSSSSGGSTSSGSSGSSTPSAS
ncbi:FmdB family transcriptional regulator [Oerskovia sp. Sa1BUA8]|uniref:FmdB family transcriptional regulator n=1 Tax=Oerskovia douganii TaxID=2762210 RepID=A0A9D5UJ25_9CELL|nr:FmdB family zinc ribbon protein [Oerskovia douganii]MBE7701457.1 FmdB family transcriptional regulator [Oerskovia douganii]